MMLEGMLLLPLIGAAVCPLAGKKSGAARDLLLRLFTLAELALAGWLFYRVWNGEEIFLYFPSMLGLGLWFYVDFFRALYALLACFMWALACQLSKEYFAGHGKSMGRYACFTLITLCGVVGVFFSDDLYTTFVFFEIMSIASYPWVAHEETPGAMRAAQTYLGVSVACGMVTLMGMLLTWREIGSLTFDALRENGGNAKLILPACLMLVGYCAKAGMTPLHIWLPKAHPVAPAPASALLSGMLTKTGLFGLIVIGMNLLGDNAVFGHVMLGVGLFTMTLGAVLGVFSVNLKRTLACSSMSQIGYITVGLSCAMLLGPHGALAAAGAVGHMVNHSLLKLCLFLCAGVIYMKAHTLDLNDLRGYGRGKWLLHIVFLIGALGLAGVPGLNGYTSKTMIHEGLVELADEINGFSLYRFCEWVFLFAAGLTTAYMLKLYICLFWQKNPDAHRQAHYDEMTNQTDMSFRSALVLLLTALPLLLIGLLPNQILLPLTQRSAAFLNRPSLSHDVAFFSLSNLMGGGVSLVIGIAVYLLFVRTVLYRKEKGYLNRWPGWLDLEELFYRPVFTRFLPWLGTTIAAFLDYIPNCKLVTVWIPRGVTAVFSFIDHLPESGFFMKFLPGVCVTIGRVFDGLMDTVLLAIRSLFLTNRKDLQHAKAHNPITRLSFAIAEGLHKIGLVPAKLIHPRAPEDERYGTYLTNAISFGLLLTAAGIVVGMLYVFIRMGH